MDTSPEPVTDPADAARAAGLRYVSDHKPGITRRRAATGSFDYFAPDGSPITDEKTLARIRALGIPPAYEDVWICPNPNGHLQATGRDARGRKQYRYHERWRAQRDETKYGRMIAFGEALPAIRKRVAADLARRGMPREKVLATVVRLLETTHIRIGNEQYARENQHYGLTTLHNEHVDVDGSTLHFHFRGKSGKQHSIDLRDKRLAQIVRRCQELPGHELFEYVDEGGQARAIGSEDVNAYLHEIVGQEFTAKDFRTWAGTLLAARTLAECEACETDAKAKRALAGVVRQVAGALGNTPAVCRKCYIHPAVFQSWREGALAAAGAEQGEEASLMALLRQCAP